MMGQDRVACCCRGRMDHMAHEEESVFEEAAACLLPRRRHLA